MYGRYTFLILHAQKRLEIAASAQNQLSDRRDGGVSFQSIRSKSIVFAQNRLGKAVFAQNRLNLVRGGAAQGSALTPWLRNSRLTASTIRSRLRAASCWEERPMSRPDPIWTRVLGTELVGRIDAAPIRR